MRTIRKRYRRLQLAGVISITTLLICIAAIFLFTKVTPKPLLQTKTEASEPLPTSLVFDKNIQVTWPSNGQAAIGSVEDGVVARSSSSEEPSSTASMAKVITALAILQKQPLQPGQSGPSYTVTTQDVAAYHDYVAKDGSVVPVYEGMQLTEYQALQAMLIPSADNIADLLTEKVFGSQEAYVAYAQNMLIQMGLSQTVIADASGFSPDTVSTPSELIKIGIAALKNPVIAKIVSEQQAQIPGIGLIKNTNELLGTDGVIGIKTGTTDSAGKCLLFAGQYTNKDGQAVTIVGVIMGDIDAPHLYNDSSALLASAEQGFGIISTQMQMPSSE